MAATQATGISADRLGVDHLIALGVLALAVALCVPAAQGLAFIWQKSEFYGHGYAIPIVACYLAYANRKAIGRAFRSLQAPAMGPVVAASVAIFEALMVMGDVLLGAGLGIPLLLGGALYAIGGFQLVLPLLLPLGFLVLMTPPPGMLTSLLLIRLKLLVTQAAVGILQATGMTVTSEGNQILLPGRTLFVADACSGLISIVAITPIACIVAYFMTRGVWRRIGVVASVVPIAMVANILRVTVTVKLVAWVGEEAAQGSLHEGFGLATTVVGTIAIVGVARIIR